jgi:transcriptional regulator with XRE-family HTH domain
MTPEEFKALRKSLGFTQKELGRIMRMEQQAIQRLEGKRAPTEVHAAFIEILDKYKRGVPWENL